MKAFLISSLYGLNGGGAGLTVSYLARGLKEAGWHISVVTLGNDQKFSYAVEEDIGIYRVRPVNLYTLQDKDNQPGWRKIIWQLADIYNNQCARVLDEILKKEAPDIVHIHKMRGLSGSVWSVATRQFPGRVVQTCHDYESMSPDGLLRGVVGRMALGRKWPIRGYQLIRSQLSSGVSKVTAPSRFTLDRIVESGLFPHAQASVVPNTHGWSKDQLNLMHKGEAVPSSDKFCFLFVGRLEHEKGIKHLCEAFQNAYEKNTKIELEIAGWGSLEGELRRMYGSHPGIRFLGAIQDSKKEDAFCKAAVVVIPSLVEEVFGLVTVEAYAFGKPVIASQVGGLPELVRDHETGWLVAPGDVDALAAQILSVAQIRTSTLKKMSQNCKEYSYQFAVERVLREYLEIYGQLKK